MSSVAVENETTIMNYLKEHQEEPQRTLVLAKLIYGKDARKKKINPLLYAMERKGMIRVIKNENGGNPCWKLV